MNQALADYQMGSRKHFGVLLPFGKIKQLLTEGLTRGEISAYQVKSPEAIKSPDELTAVWKAVTKFARPTVCVCHLDRRIPFDRYERWPQPRL